jgi:hypothetical protein
VKYRSVNMPQILRSTHHFIVDSSYKVNFYDIKHYSKIILNIRADYTTATELKNGLTSMYILLPFPLIS